MIKIAETNEFFKESFKKEKNRVMRAARFNSLASNVISFLSQSLLTIHVTIHVTVTR